MEVHHHAHTHGKKNWKSYIWEFLMLFLAVFCGFLAEYQLEHKIEKEREHEFITSLVSDLKDDTLNMTAQIENLKKGIVLYDSLSTLLESPEVARKNVAEIYYTSRMGIRQSRLINNTRTFDQLKNAGGFRLIRDQETSNRIMNYYSGFPELRMMEEFFIKENMAFKEVASKIMDQSVYRKQINADGSVARVSGNLSLLSYDPVQLNQLGFFAIQMNGSRSGMIPQCVKLRESAVELIQYLQKEYHLQ